ncbi:MAG: hypothetical protein ABSF09_00315 [Candidatus Bathyarchaeia archaeon]
MKAIDEALSKVEVPKEVPITKHHFLDYFKGFEKVAAVREIFGDQTNSVLSALEVEFFNSRSSYMGVNNESGHLVINANYLKKGDKLSIYLDIIHELVHVRQFREGKELFDENYAYVDRPTELEAFKHAMKEARRLGMDDDEIFDYLKVPTLNDEQARRLVDNLNVKPSRYADSI